MGNRPQPDVPGNLTPRKLLSFDEMCILQEHYRLVSKCSTAADHEKALKGWSDRQRKVVKGLYDRLLHNGFVIDGQHEEGTLFFGTRMKSKAQLLMELSDIDFKAYQEGKLVFNDGMLQRVGP